MKTVDDRSGRRSPAGIRHGLAWAAAAGLAAAPAWAANYHWHGSASSDWGTSANWGSNSMAPTGGTYDATLYITNRTLNRLVYSEANGNTVYTSGARCLRIADGSNGSLAVTGGSLETRGTGDFIGNSAGSGLLLVDGGTYVSTNAAFNLGANNGAGTLTVSNGFARVGTLNLWCSVGTVNLVGGTLGIGTMSLTAGAGLATLNLNGGTVQAWKNTGAWMLASSNWTCRLNGPVVFDTPDSYVTNAASINGSGTLTKSGAGLLALNVSNTIAAVTVKEGALSLGGSNTISGGVTLNGGTLNVNHESALGSSALAINGGRVDNITAAAVSNALGGPINIWNNFTYGGTRELNLGAGAVTMYTNLTLACLARTLTFGGTVGDGGSNYTLTVVSNGMLNLTGSLAIGGRLTVSGGGFLTLAGANSYTGATTVTGAGTLVVANSGALGTTNSTTEVAYGSVIQLLNGVAVEGESLYLSGGGTDNKGALQAALNTTSAWNGPVILNDNRISGYWSPRFGYKAGSVLSVGGPIKPGAGNNLWISGDQGVGRVIIAGTNNTYSGITGIVRGTLALGANNALPVATTLDMHPAVASTDYSRFDLGGFSQTLASLYETSASAPRLVTNSSETASTLTLNQTANTVYAGRIDGSVSLVKDGSGSLTLGGPNNTYTGTTTLKNGTLALDASGALSPATSLTLSGGTLAAGPWTNTLQQLTVLGSCSIDVGDGTGRLEFADSSGQPWSGTLNLTGTLDVNTIRFGTSAAGLTQQQLDLIRVNGTGAWLTLGADGYLREIRGTYILVL